MRWFWVLLVLAGPQACAKPAPRSTDLGQRLQSLLDSTMKASPQVPGLILRVEAPPIGLRWTNAVGVFDRATGEPLRPEHTVRMASNTKTYVAAAVLRLMELGKLDLEAPVARYLSPESTRQLARGGYDPQAITVRMLLQHTSGIFDYAMSPQFATAVSTRFSHRWTRAEQIAFAVDSGKPLGKPDELYSYSDTGYILLGEIIERVTGLPMGRAVSELLGFDRHGITATYFETLDSVPEGTPPRAHQYLDSVDAYTLDASHDLYGGGGLVSNLENMARFYRALVRGELFEKKGTLVAMLQPTPQSQAKGVGYGMGIGLAKVGEVTCHGHSGYWGTTVRHCPAIDLTVATAMNRSPDSTGTMVRLAEAAIRLVQEEGRPRR
jgi:D-alanyl-D-alanine carboxypeptidase